MYVVHAVAPQGESPFEHPFKAFSQRSTAVDYANQKVRDDAEHAMVYEVVGIEDARKAVAAVEMGKGVLIDAKSKRLDEEAMRRLDKAEWDRALKAGPEAIFKYLGL